MIYFCDTSAVIKLYHEEIGTSFMESIFNDIQSAIIISELTTVEFYSALSKKFRTGDISERAKEQAISNFQKDCKNKFIVTPLNRKIVREAITIINKYGNEASIRTLDAIQLAASLMENMDDLIFVCSDIKLIKICKLENMETKNPETEE